MLDKFAGEITGQPNLHIIIVFILVTPNHIEQRQFEECILLCCCFQIEYNIYLSQLHKVKSGCHFDSI